jgi:hypothetical protein
MHTWYESRYKELEGWESWYIGTRGELKHVCKW